MKTTTMAVFAAAFAVASFNASGFAVYMPPGNIVQNGNFQSFADWSGNIYAGLGNWSSVPGDDCLLAFDIYQDLPTNPGQQYSLSYYAAADLYLAPRNVTSYTINLVLNQQTVGSIATHPYTYNSGLNRYDEMQWQQYTTSFVATGSTTRLEFINPDPYDFALAAVSVVPVPEPSSTALILITGAVTICCQRADKSRRSRSNSQCSMGS